MKLLLSAFAALLLTPITAAPRRPQHWRTSRGCRVLGKVRASKAHPRSKPMPRQLAGRWSATSAS
ncbi:hypothetical protein NJ75_00672 [Novosphingobium subterraneum]|uniref:Uncharacterized protein n=1 Tax=Novosphingobium subterraneum TaxID=48936 RepID=A0A0B8ZRY9_9SPHN|nr:hypothetical protein NJ75_00672 [Novosphingobium subterraneum]